VEIFLEGLAGKTLRQKTTGLRGARTKIKLDWSLMVLGTGKSDLLAKKKKKKKGHEPKPQCSGSVSKESNRKGRRLWGYWKVEWGFNNNCLNDKKGMTEC